MHELLGSMNFNWYVGMSNTWFWLVGWELAWELDIWDKSGGYGMRNMNLVWDRRNSMSLIGRSHGGV